MFELDLTHAFRAQREFLLVSTAQGLLFALDLALTSAQRFDPRARLIQRLLRLLEGAAQRLELRLQRLGALFEFGKLRGFRSL